MTLADREVGNPSDAIGTPTQRGRFGDTRRSAWALGWPLGVLTAGMPVLFLLGVHGLAWALPGVVFGYFLLRHPQARIPRGLGWLGLFCCWALLSLIQLRAAGSIMLFGYRWLTFVGAFTAAVWIANVPEGRWSSRRIESWLATLWIWMIVFGYLALALTTFRRASPLLMLLPGGLAKMDFLKDISEWRLAEVQGFLGYSLARPSAPFPMANGWGAGLGLLTPFFVKVWLVDARGGRRLAGVVLLLIALRPIILSLNRGLWISLGVALVYFALRSILRGGDLRPLLAVIAVGVTLAGVLTLTPAGDLINERIERSTDSNESRGNLYELAFQGALDNPLTGHGAPTRVEHTKMPPIGTHGMVWYLMYVHGFMGLALFGTWLIGEVIRSGRIRSPGDWWPHLGLVVAVVQVAFYGLLPQVVLIGVFAGLARRRAQLGSPRRGTAIVPEGGAAT